jgi:hypothetical protein
MHQKDKDAETFLTTFFNHQYCGKRTKSQHRRQNTSRPAMREEKLRKKSKEKQNKNKDSSIQYNKLISLLSFFSFFNSTLILHISL